MTEHIEQLARAIELAHIDIEQTCLLRPVKDQERLECIARAILRAQVNPPPEMVEVGAQELSAEDDEAWVQMDDGIKDNYRAEATAVYVAMTRAWLGEE